MMKMINDRWNDYNNIYYTTSTGKTAPIGKVTNITTTNIPDEPMRAEIEVYDKTMFYDWTKEWSMTIGVIPDCTKTAFLRNIDRIIFNPPATIVIWKDGHKEVVKCSEDEIFEPEVGVAMAFVKRIFGSRHQFTKMVDDFMPEEPDLRDIIEEGWKSIKKKYKLSVRKKSND